MITYNNSNEKPSSGSKYAKKSVEKEESDTSDSDFNDVQAETTHIISRKGNK